MQKENNINKEFYEKVRQFFEYREKILSLKNNITDGHKQRFINILIEILKFKGKTMQMKNWTNFVLIFSKKEINKSKKVVDEPVQKKLEQLLQDFANNLFTNNCTSHQDCASAPSIEDIFPKNEPNNSSNSNVIQKLKNDLEQNLNDKNVNESLNKNNNTGLNHSQLNMNKTLGKRKINDFSTINNADSDTNSKLRKKINLLINSINTYDTMKDYLINSIDRESKNNKLFCDILQFTSDNLTKESESTKENVLTLICLIFPFISNKQKQQLLLKEKLFDQKLINIFKEIKILNKSKNNYMSEFILQSILNKEANVEYIAKIFQNNLFIYNIVELIELYQLYLISRIFNFYNTNDFIYKITFKIKFILKNYNEIYARQLNCNINKIYKIFWRLKNFYKIYQNKLIIDKKDKINGVNFLNEEKKDCQLVVNNSENHLDGLFFEEDNRIFEEFTNKINMFYKINKDIDLFSGYSKELKNYDFPFNIIELINIKNELMVNDFQRYKMNLINIEKLIFIFGYNSLFPYNNLKINYNISSYVINPNLKYTVKYLDFYLHRKLFNYKFKLYPYGSVTQFLSDKDSDIDLYLDTSEIASNKSKIKFLYALIFHIRNFDKKASMTISTRVCVITFEFKNISFDISVVGFCPYMHSNLIREYSLIDSRFPLLVIAIKHITKILKINNISDDKTHSFLNSFSWVLLLIGFLQDIVNPPVLPKILENSEIIEKETFFGNNKVEKDDDDEKSNWYENKYEKISKTKNFDSFINTMEKEYIKLPKNLGDKNFRFSNYKSQIVLKNTMSCSELLLKFLEFVIFYFKYDTLFVNCSFIQEGFENMESINNEKYDEDLSFVNYFKGKFIKKNNGEKNKDGYFLIRDPFDSRYNPAQTLKLNSLKKFLSRLKMAYYDLVKNGNLDIVKKQIEIEEKKIN